MSFISTNYTNKHKDTVEKRLLGNIEHKEKPKKKENIELVHGPSRSPRIWTLIFTHPHKIAFLVNEGKFKIYLDRIAVQKTKGSIVQLDGELKWNNST